MKNITMTLFVILITSCSHQSKSELENKVDTISVSEQIKVEKILSNDDSLIKAKEKELIEKYK